MTMFDSEKPDIARNHIFLCTLAIIFLFPLAAQANMGTPLMWGSFAYLVFGNLFIGIGEGLLLKLFRPSRRFITCILVMVAANYFSAWIGFFCLDFITPVSDTVGIAGIRGFILAMIIIAYILTIVLEAPFVWWIFRDTEHCLSKLVWGSITIQTISYLVIIPLFCTFSATSAHHVNVVDKSQMSLPENLTMRYISEDGKCRQVELSTGIADEYHFEQIAATNKPSWHDHAIIGHNHAWTVSSGFWAAEGLHAENKQTGERFSFALETPFAMWHVRNVSQLPDDKIIFSLGNSQICIADPAKKEVTLFARGSNPIVVEKDQH